MRSREAQFTSDNRKKNARGPVSRVLSSAIGPSTSSGLRRMGDHSSSPAFACRIKQSTRATEWRIPICRPYSILLPVGFAVAANVATRAVRSCRTLSPLPARRLRPSGLGGMLSVALSLTRLSQSHGGPPGVTRHRSSLEPGLSSPAAIKQQQRPPGPLADHPIAGPPS